MPLLVAILLTLLLVALTRSFVLNAIALKRDIDRRFDDLRIRLESEASATLEGFLEAQAGHDAQR